MKRIVFTTIFLASIASCAVAQEASDTLTQQLQEVIITAKVPVTELRGTALVSRIPGSSLENLGTCLDVLRQLPMIHVKAEDNSVSVIGKGAPLIYIDGRPLRSQEELIRLQSDNIKTVELEMAPGARYDSDVQAVLKITTRHGFANGFSLTNRAQVDVRRRVSAMDWPDLNYRTGAWDFFAEGGFNHNRIVMKGSTTNHLIYNGAPAVVGGSQRNDSPADVWGIKPGFNYSKGALSFGGYYNYNPEHGDFTNRGTECLNDETPLERQICQQIKSRTHRGSVYFENTFREKYTLHFDGDCKFAHADTDNSTTYSGDLYPPVNAADTRTSSLWAGKLTLDFPLGKGKFGVGTQDSYTHTTLDYRMFNADVAQYVPSSLTDARQTSLAAFALWSRTFGKLGLSTGLRYEYVDYDFLVNGERDRDVSRRDHLLTPDLSFSWQFSERAQLSLSYKMSTVKPSYSRLTSALTYTGRHEIEGGNPALRDEHRHNLQLFGMWNDFVVQATYARSLDSYGFVRSVYPAASSLQLLMRPVNLDFSNLSCYLMWQRTIKVWTPSATAGVSKQWLTYAGRHYEKPLFVYFFDNTFALPWGITATANARGQSSGHMSTTRFAASWFVMDIGLSKSFLKKALTLQLSATDVFNTRCNDWTMNTCGVYVDARKSYDARGIMLSLTYRLWPRKSRYQGKSAAEDEMNRL